MLLIFEYAPQQNLGPLFSATGLAGLEPTTYGLGNRRSIRLSYSPLRSTRIGIMGVKAGEVIATGACAG